MSMMRNFDKDFVQRTVELLSGDIKGKSIEYDVTLQLNCLLAMITLPLERKRDENNLVDQNFKKSCVEYLKNNASIVAGNHKQDKYIMMDIRDAIAHLNIQVEPDPYGNIDSVILKNDFSAKNRFECRMTVETLKKFAQHVSQEYLKHYFSI